MNTQENKESILKWKDVSVHSYVKMVMIAVPFFMLFEKQIYGNMLHRWMTDSSWSHGFLIPLFSLYFLNQHKKDILSVETKPAYSGWFIIAASLGVFILNVVQIKIGTLFAVLIIPTLIGVVVLMAGYRMLRYTWLPIMFLFFAIPIPDRIYKAITIPMRILAAQIASGLLSLVKDIETTSRGVVIDVVYKGQAAETSLDVAEACSGMRLLMAFVALGVAMAYLHKRHWFQRIVLLACTVPIAILCNVVRVTVTGFIYILIAPKYAQGIYHDVLGMLMLPLAFGLYGLLAWFMSSLFVEESEMKEPVEEIIISRKKKDSCDE